MKFNFFNKPKVERIVIDENKYKKPEKAPTVEPVSSKEELDALWDKSSVAKIDKGESLEKMNKEN